MQNQFEYLFNFLYAQSPILAIAFLSFLIWRFFKGTRYYFVSYHQLSKMGHGMGSSYVSVKGPIFKRESIQNAITEISGNKAVVIYYKKINYFEFKRNK